MTMEKTELMKTISEQLQKGKAKDVKALVSEAIEAGIPAGEILSEGLLAGMSVVGDRFRANEIFV
ncbi:MAG: B12-binding domain-containing protein, partial [Clostridia bacterium]|nr:B12-binding domain-containing protein [Clostridia bacterium]